jgi:hypothetical protein
VKNVERCEELKYYEMKIDELDVLLVDEEMKAAYWELRKNPAMLPVDEDGTLKEFYMHNALDMYYRRYPDKNKTAQSTEVDPVESPEDGACYWLHPELVHSTGVGEEATEATFVCQNCHNDLSKNFVVPKYNVSNVHLGSCPRPKSPIYGAGGAARHHYCGEGPGEWGGDERSH